MGWSAVEVIIFSSLLWSETVSKPSGNKVFLVLIDGLRYDSVSGAQLPGFRSLEKSGVKANWLRPNFPTVGYPNYFSLLTGLYPESHGVTDDNLYDYDTNSFLVKGTTSGGDNNPTKWVTTDQTFPQTAAQNGLNSILINWPGCKMIPESPTGHRCLTDEVETVGNRTTVKGAKLRAEEKSASLIRMATKGLDELSNGTADVVFLFVKRVDMAGHANGPKSQNYRRAIMTTDNLIVHLRKSLAESGLESVVNLIVMSPHGMMNMRKPTLVVDITKFAPFARSAATFPHGGPYLTFYPHKGTLPKIFNPLFKRSHRHIKVYWKWNTPAKWHLREGKFVAPVLVVADPGWIVVTTRKEALFHAKNRYGYHGWDPEKSKDMMGTFFATGPDFKRNFSTKEIHINDVYNLLCQISGITAAPNNGSAEVIQQFLLKYDHLNTTTTEILSTTTRTPEIVDGNSTTEDLVTAVTEKPTKFQLTTTITNVRNESTEDPIEIEENLNVIETSTSQLPLEIENFTQPINISLVENDLFTPTTTELFNISSIKIESDSNLTASENRSIYIHEGSGEELVTHYFDPTYSPATVEYTEGSGENLPVADSVEPKETRDKLIEHNDTSLEGSAEESDVVEEKKFADEPLISLLSTEDQLEEENLADSHYLTANNTFRRILLSTADESVDLPPIKARLNSSTLINPSPDVLVKIRQYQAQNYEGNVKLTGESRAENKVHFEQFEYQLSGDSAVVNQHFGDKLLISPTLTDIFHLTPPHLVLIDSLKRLQDESELDGNETSKDLLASFNRQMKCDAFRLANATFYDNPECGGDQSQNQSDRDYGVNSHLLSYFERIFTADPKFHLQGMREEKSTRPDQIAIDSIPTENCPSAPKKESEAPKTNQFNVQSGGSATQIIIERPTVVINVIRPLFVLQLGNDTDVLDSVDREILLEYLNGGEEEIFGESGRAKREEKNSGESPGIQLNLNQKIEVENEGNSSDSDQLFLALINSPKNVANVRLQQYNIENAKFHQTQHYGAEESISPTFNQIQVDLNPTLVFLQLIQLLQNQPGAKVDLNAQSQPQNIRMDTANNNETKVDQREKLKVKISSLNDQTVDESKANPTDNAKVSVDEENLTLNQFNVDSGGEVVQILVKQPDLVLNIRKSPVELISLDSVMAKSKLKRSARDSDKRGDIRVKISQKVEIENEKISPLEMQNVGENHLRLQIHHYAVVNGSFTQSQHFGPHIEVSPTINRVEVNHQSPQVFVGPLPVDIGNQTGVESIDIPIDNDNVETSGEGEIPPANDRLEDIFFPLPTATSETKKESDGGDVVNLNQFNVASGGSLLQICVENLKATVTVDDFDEEIQPDAN